MNIKKKALFSVFLVLFLLNYPTLSTANVMEKTCHNITTLKTKVYFHENGNATDIEFFKTCPFNCSNYTISTLGNPGCQEGELYLGLIAILIIIVVIIIVRFLL